MTDPPSTEPSQPAAPRRGGCVGAALSTSLVVGAALLGLVTLAGRSVSAPPFLLTAAVTFLPYLYGVCLAACFAVWVLAPDRRLPPLCGTVVVVWAAVLWGPAWAPRGQVDASGDHLTLMSWNVRRLWGGPTDGGDTLRCATQAIEASDPDVLTLLEVSAEDTDALSAALGLTCVHHPYRHSTSRKHGGLAACTRGSQWRLRSGAGQRFVDDEDWFYVFSEVVTAGRVVNLLAVHLHPYEYGASRYEIDGIGEAVRGQADQSAALLDRVRKLQDPTVVAGDFNSTRDVALHHALRRSMTDAWERGGLGFGATATFLGLPLRIDYVYVSDQLVVGDSTVPDVGCSDHRPVVTHLVLADD